MLIKRAFLPFEMEYSHEIRVPKDRLAVLIGVKGRIKRDIEEKTKTKLTVDSKESIVFLQGTDSISVFLAQQIVKAISRGFSPDVALQLLRIDKVFEVVNMVDFIKHKDHLDRVRGRVIGTDGKTRNYIQELTETNICIYGKTVGIIGQPEYVALARKSIESLLQGSPHSNVYRWLEKQKKVLKRREYEEEDGDFLKDDAKKDLAHLKTLGK